MPDNKSISQLTPAEQTTSSDLFETSIPNGSLGYLSRKVSLDAIADYIGTDHLFASDLQTTNKTLTGAINEAAQSGGGGASIEEMTQAEYNALTPEQKADGTLRAISDATTSISDIDDVNISSVADGDALIYDSTSSKWVNREIEADAVAYDNTSSGLTATNVNAAIDEVVDDISTVTGTITLETGFTARGTPIVEKRNGIVFLQFNINGTNAFNTRTTLGNISAGFRPYRTCAFTVCASKNINSFANITTTMLITLSGDIIVGDLVLPADSNIKEVNACVTYVARN